jgi:hypothetical protein
MFKYDRRLMAITHWTLVSKSLLLEISDDLFHIIVTIFLHITQGFPK